MKHGTRTWWAGSLKGRFGEPWETIGPALFLASRASSYVTGTALISDTDGPRSELSRFGVALSRVNPTTVAPTCERYPLPRGTKFSYLLPVCYLPVTGQRYKGAGWCVPGAHNPLLRFNLGRRED